jgi:lipid A 3-O-deacylase
VVNLRKIGMALTMLLGCAMPGMAQDIPAGVPSAGVLDIVDEVRIGGGYHMVYWTMLPQNPGDWYMDRPEDITFDVLFTSPDMDAFRWIGAPRPEIGATINTHGEDSMFHAGLTWQAHVFDTPFYVEGTFGAATHTGYLTDAPDGRREYGCRVNFYERFGVGVDITEQATATLTYEHMSNAGLCGDNAGISNFGLRLGWKF